VHKKLGNHDRRRRRSSLVACSVRPRTSERRSVRSSYYERNHVRSSIVQRTFLPQNQKYQISFLPLVTQKQTFFSHSPASLNILLSIAFQPPHD
jgi:hypothetical protein